MTNYPATWPESFLKEIFSKYGYIKSLEQWTKKGTEGQEEPFAFVCYDKQGDDYYGPACIDAAMKDLKGKDIEGVELILQLTIPKVEHEAQLLC